MATYSKIQCKNQFKSRTKVDRDKKLQEIWIKIINQKEKEINGK